MRLQPFTVIVGDMPANYSQLTLALLPSDTFTDSQYLGEFSRGAYYLLLLGTIVAGITLFMCVHSLLLSALGLIIHYPLSGLIKHTLGYLAATALAIIGSAFLLIGAVIWTVIVKKAQSINTVMVGQPGNIVPVGIEVDIGNGIYLAWAAFACLIASTVPYMIRCAPLNFRSIRASLMEGTPTVVARIVDESMVPSSAHTHTPGALDSDTID